MAHQLEIREVRLDLLQHCMNIAKPPLKRIAREHRRGSGGVIDPVDNVFCLMRGIGAGELQGRALLERGGLAVARSLPRVLQRVEQVAARGRKLRFGDRHLRLHHRTVAQGSRLG